MKKGQRGSWRAGKRSRLGFGRHYSQPMRCSTALRTQCSFKALKKAFAADPTSEDLAQALMRAHLRLGQNSEAIRVHRRLREMLSLLLSIAPSAESDDIRDQAYAAESKKTANAVP